MDLAVITMQQVGILFFMILAGYASVRYGLIKMESKKAFSELLMNLVVPAMILESYMAEFDMKVFSNLMLTFGLGILLHALAVVVTLIVTRKKKNDDAAILKFACIFSNAGYMGFPLIRALFGMEGLLYASAFLSIFTIFMWTIGYILVSGEVDKKRIVRNICTQPSMISIVLGLIIYLGRIKVPAMISQPLGLLGAMNTPLSMIITGMMIAGSNLKRMFTDRRQVFIVAVRMFLIPALSFLLLKIMGIHGMVVEAVLLLEACPTAAVTSVFAVQFGHDEELAAGAVVITTFLSIFTLPMWALVLAVL